MKKMLFTLWSLVAVFALTGCSDDDGVSSGDVVHKVGTVYFIADESSQVVPLQNIQTDEFTAWRPDADSWLSLEHIEGNQLIVRVEENFGRVRTSKITVRAGGVIEEIPVYQMEKRSVRFDGIDVVKLRGVGETQDIPLLISNMEPPYTVESESDWVSAVIIDPNQPTPSPEPTPTPAPANQPVVDGEQSHIMRLTMEENIPGAGERTATLTVKGFMTSGAEVSYKISVSQAATYRKSYSFSIPEFPEGVKIYKVMDESGNQIAEVCKEWLGDVNAPSNVKAIGIDMSAVVVYPMGENGKANIDKGYIANVLRINSGENNYTYRNPDFHEEIYGGIITWDKENNCISSYTKGTLNEAPDKIYLPGDNYFLTEEALPNAVEASLVPYVVEDKRPNDTPRTYTVVKVGTQYWFDHNLMAKYYVDGTLIEENTASRSALKPSILITYTKADGTVGSTYNSQIDDAYVQEQIEITLQKYGACYNFNTLNKTIIPEGTTLKDYWAPFRTLCYNTYYYDIPESENMLCPAGWMPPNEDEITLYQNYVQDQTKYLDLGILDSNGAPITNNYYTRHWRVRDMSLYPDTALANHGFTDENITGFSDVLTPRQNGGTISVPSGKNLTFTYFLSRTIMPFISGNGSNGALDDENPGITCFTGQNGSFKNRWFGMGVDFCVRCIRLD